MSASKEKYIKLSTVQGLLSNLASSYFSSASKLEGNPAHSQTKREFASRGDLCISIAKELEALSINVSTEVKHETALSI